MFFDLADSGYSSCTQLVIRHRQVCVLYSLFIRNNNNIWHKTIDKSNQLMPILQTDEVGEILHLAKSGRLIVKLNTSGAERIKPGELLIDGSGRRVGKVAELLGPVKTPYASVITMTDRTSKLVGSKVFGGGFAKKPRDRRRGFSRSSSR